LSGREDLGLPPIALSALLSLAAQLETLAEEIGKNRKAAAGVASAERYEPAA